MNKIISANINGFVFSIDELAYAKLKTYLDVVRQKVDNSEIAQDIENRIAELFNEKLKNGKQAIFDNDVDEVMEQIGKPDQFTAEEGNESAQPGNEQQGSDTQTQARRRLYRDNDDKVIGGVCSGISAYFGLDPAIVRLGFAASFFLFGTGFLLYIVLMIVLPKASTPAEKLEMRGEPVDYKNLSKTVERDFKEAFQRYKPEVKTGFQRFVEIMVRIGIVAMIIFMVMVFIPGCFGILTAIGVASWSMPTLSAYMFTDQTDSLIILFGMILFVVIPLIGIGYSILRFAFKVKPMNKVLSIGFSVFWFVGFCMLGWSTYNIGMQFSQKERIEVSDTLKLKTGNNQLLVLRTRLADHHSGFILRRNEEDEESYTRIRTGEDMKEAIDNEIRSNVELNIVHGFTESPVVRIRRSANGKSTQDAYASAEDISYSYELRDSTLWLDEFFSIGSNKLWRNQKVLITVEVPASYRLFIDRSCESILDLSWRDEDEVTGRYLRVDHRGIKVE